jgi:ornithine carbamoyltransferase
MRQTSTVAMPLSNEACGPEASRQLSPLDVARLLCRARILQRAVLEGSPPPLLLRGKNLAVLRETPDDEALALFRRAAEELGARVATTRSGLTVSSSPQEVQHTARMLGRLYDAVECQGIDAALARQIAQHAGIPVHEGIAMANHGTARLAELLGDRTPLADNRRFVLQALLLESIA